LSMSVHCRESI